MKKHLFTKLAIILTLALCSPHAWADELTKGQELFADMHECGGWSENSFTKFRFWYGDGGSDYVDVDGTFLNNWLWMCYVPREGITRVQLERVNASDHSQHWHWTSIFDVESDKDVLKPIESSMTWTSCNWYKSKTIYATPSTLTYTNSASWDPATKTLKANVKVGDNPDRFLQRTMAPTGKTYNGELLYSCQIYCIYNGVHLVQFQVYEGETYKGEKEFDKSSKSWSFTDCLTNISGKIYDNNDWRDYHRDVTVYSVGSYFSNPTWDNSNSTMKIDVRREGSDNDFDYSTNRISNADMTNTGYTYNGYPIYSYRFLELQDGGQCRFKHYVSGTWKENYAAAWGESAFLDGKIYIGYSSSHHNWITYATDIELDQQGGSSGNESVTATVGENMPSATMPEYVGYNFGGYFTATGGGGDKYYNADGSSAATWIKDGPKILYAKWTEKTWSVSFTNDGHGTVTLPATSPQTVGEVTGIAINASNNTGYHFSTWTIVTGSGSFTSTASTASNTFKPTSATTLRADFAPNTSTVALDKGTHGSANSSMTINYDATTYTSFTPVTSVGYTCTGYFDETGVSPVQVLKADGTFHDTNVSGYITGGKWSKDGDCTLVAHWTEATLTFKATTNSNWSLASNWDPACVPTIEHNVVIEKPVIVDVTSARAKSVVLDQHSGNTGSLTINAGKELVIAGTLRKTTDGSSYGATAAEDVVINSDASNGLGGLVMGSHDGTNQATVNFYSKSGGKNASEKWVWVNQYVGTPFGNSPAAISQFYDSWMYKIGNKDDGNIDWFELNPYEGLTAFKGYSVISNTNVGHTYEMEGTLVASADTVLSLYWYNQVATNPNNENLLANSWMAPIKISEFETSDFTHATATIYIFNAGSLDDYNTEETPVPTGSSPGQYSTYTIKYAGDAVIPAMQSFSVFANALEKDKDDCRLALDYSRLVYDPAVAGTTPESNKSPRRAKAEASEREEMQLYVRGENGPADRLTILSHEDFDEGFENGWDGHKIFGEAFTPQLYAMTPDGNMAVNCIPDFEGTVLGFQAGNVDSSYTFYFRYDGAETLYLNDLKEEESTLINDENTYSFISAAEDTEARFVISATPIHNTPTGIDDLQNNKEQATKARKLFINGALYIIRSGRMYDVLGKTVTHHE